MVVFFLLLQATLFAQRAPVKVACIGNSVTVGFGLVNSALDSYPSQLQVLLGEMYDVKNFGYSGATLLQKGHNPYYKTTQFAGAIAFKPDIAIIHLGLNDTDPRNWPYFRDDFEADYAWLLDSIKKVNPAVKLFICRLTPIFSDHARFKSGTREWYGQIHQRIPVIAMANHTRLIDLHEKLYRRPDLFTDALHPGKEGAAIIAQTIYENITGNFGGLQLPAIFTDNMVLQRGQPIVIYGTADAGERITIDFNQQTLSIVANEYGQWKVGFPAMKAGGPYQLTVHSSRRTLVLKNILLGDVWFCSGQSNMAFPLSSSAKGEAEIMKAGNNSNLRFFNFKSIRETDNSAWDSLTLAKTNKLQFFEGKWSLCDSVSAAEFSAIAYYFGKKIATEENVPIGLILVAVGGSSIESWIDRYTLEHDDKVVDLLSNWRKSDYIIPWVRERAGVNLRNATNSKQRHPYDPAYNFEAGVDAFTKFSIKGVIWYQGESNVHNVELYEHLLPVLVNNWREKWGYNFPFYYVQLSGIDRPSWPAFRDAQNRLQKIIPNSGMAISMDYGDSLNVHPVRKKEVGDRLAGLALHYTYKKPVIANGPVATSISRQQNTIVITFSYAKYLLTSDKKELTGFELINDKGMRLETRATINKNKVSLIIPTGEKIKTVLYAWKPFTRANLVNEAGLPASTFSWGIGKGGR